MSYCRVYIYYIYIWQYRNIAKRFRYGIRFCIEAFCVSLERAKVKGSWRIAGVATDEANSDFHRLAEYGQMRLRAPVHDAILQKYSTLFPDRKIDELAEEATSDYVLGKLHTSARLDKITGQKFDIPKECANCVRVIIFAELAVASDPRNEGDVARLANSTTGHWK